MDDLHIYANRLPSGTHVNGFFDEETEVVSLMLSHANQPAVTIKVSLGDLPSLVDVIDSIHYLATGTPIIDADQRQKKTVGR